MSPLGPPPRPARFGQLMNNTVDIQAVQAKVGVGGIGLSEVTGTEHSDIPCSFRPVSTTENEAYGVEMNETMYEMTLPVLSLDGTDITVSGDGTQRRFVIDGKSYEPVGTAISLVPGMQKVMLKRLGD